MGEEVNSTNAPMPKLVFDGKRYVKGDNAQMGGGAEQQVDYPVPSNRAGVVIGKGGETINQIKENSGAFVQINKTPPQDHPDWKYFTIRGNQQQIATAQKLIQEKVGGPAPPGAAISQNASSNGTYNYNSSSYPSSGQSGYQSGSGQQDY